MAKAPYDAAFDDSELLRLEVEDLDRKAVKHHERIKAAELVPNLDKVHQISASRLGG